MSGDGLSMRISLKDQSPYYSRMCGNIGSVCMMGKRPTPLFHADVWTWVLRYVRGKRRKGSWLSGYDGEVEVRYETLDIFYCSCISGTFGKIPIINSHKIERFFEMVGKGIHSCTSVLLAGVFANSSPPFGGALDPTSNICAWSCWWRPEDSQP